MSSLKAKLVDIFSDTFEQCGYERKFGLVVESQRTDLGQFQCNGALAVAKAAKKNPREIAQEIISSLENNPIIDNLTIAGPGFINISVKDTFIAVYINSLTGNPRLGCRNVEEPHTIVIDFGSPNIAKPMHVGHLRSAIIGDSLQRLFSFLGNTVICDNHMGDWGTQIGMLICELKERKPNLIYFDSALGGPYPEKPPLH